MFRIVFAAKVRRKNNRDIKKSCISSQNWYNVTYLQENARFLLFTLLSEVTIYNILGFNLNHRDKEKKIFINLKSRNLFHNIRGHCKFAIPSIEMMFLLVRQSYRLLFIRACFISSYFFFWESVSTAVTCWSSFSNSARICSRVGRSPSLGFCQKSV